MTIKFIVNEKGSPDGKLADAEIHFLEGELTGLRLIGFGVWQRRNGNGMNITFPARTYSVNGERRSFALLRPILDASGDGQNALRDKILAAWREHEAAVRS
jgi:hypothetical protein